MKKRLGEVAKIIGGGTPDTNIKEYWSGNIQWFTPTEIKSNFVTKSIRTITELGLKKSSAKLLPKGTILLTTRATIGEVAIANEECSTNQGFQSLVTNKLTNNIFISNWIKRNKNEFIKRANGSTFPEIGKSEIENILIYLPLIYEQQKISSFLSLIDEKISSQIKIIEELKLLKHTLIKKLFSYQLKFNDDNGNNFFEWRDIMLGDIGQVITGKTPSTKDLDLWDGDVQFVTPTDMNESKYQYSSKRTIKRTENLKILPPKSIMFTCIASIGKMSLSLKPCVTNQQINSIIPNSGFNNEFIFYAVANISEFIKSIQSSSTMPIINKTEFSKFKISVPSLKEQTKIADFLTSIDKKINIEIKVAQKLEDQKSFLLQQLFI
ncbi:restriction endonuclease subunit S [Chryseobacterium indologenes]|uniref:restriction endonuclease subunit S n=1 Tax=Chryseobacterium indologenes TaxID=253 RepID=UPI0021CD209D|nr:restriction endonuclease subunit S [Chryseobacterium indologenes]